MGYDEEISKRAHAMQGSTAQVRQAPAEQLLTAIDNLDDIKVMLSQLLKELRGELDEPTTGADECMRPAPYMCLLLSDGAGMIEAKRSDCMRMISELRDILL